MRMFRLLLTLMLCLSVPLAGWASVMSGPDCPRWHAPDETNLSHAVVHHHSAADGDHCDDHAGHGGPCQGDHCGCGCGFGLCAGSAVSLTAPPSASLLDIARSQAVPLAATPWRLDSPDGSLLRPPIA